MKQLKWLWYLKSLKLLSSILLIGFFGFWVSSFVNASFSLWIVWQDATSVENQNYDISILANYEFKTTFWWVNKRLFSPSQNYIWWWWTTWNMHYSNVYFTTKYNWIVKYFYLCDYIETLTNFSNCTKYLYSSNLEVVKNILNNVSAGDTFFYGEAWSYMDFNAVSVQSLNQTIVFPVMAIQTSSTPSQNSSISAIWISFNWNDCNNIQSNWWICNLDNYDNSIWYDFSTLPNNLIWVSPWFPAWWWDSWTWDSNTWVFYTNQNVYNSLYNKWYRKQLCYWWFWLDDLFLTWSSSFSWIVAWSGATVFDLFNIYSWWLDFNTWYDNNYLDYIYLKEFRDYYEYSNFLDKSKWLVWLWLVRDSFFKWSDFNTSNYKFFCNLVINFPWSIDTSSDSALSFLDNSLSENLISDIIWDIDILIPTSWSALGFTIQNLCDSWDLSGALCSWDFSWYNSDLWGSIQNSRNTWSLSWIKEWVIWLLPTYIIVWFFWILILYYLRR